MMLSYLKSLWLAILLFFGLVSPDEDEFPLWINGLRFDRDAGRDFERGTICWTCKDRGILLDWAEWRGVGQWHAAFDDERIWVVGYEAEEAVGNLMGKWDGT